MGKTTRIIRVGTVKLGGGLPIVLQSMAAAKTANAEKTAETCRRLTEAGAGIVRIAVDTPQDAEALREIRRILQQSPTANRSVPNLSVDLQENYRLAEAVAPFVDKIRYNPGHLYHAEPDVPWQTKVERIVQIARQHQCALRIGVNCGSLDPAFTDGTLEDHGGIRTAIQSAMQHAEYIDSLGFDQFCVSIKSSDPKAVLFANRQFSERRPDIPIHLGLTEAGLPPTGITKSRAALEPLLAQGIGDTLRVSLTVPNDRKAEEIVAGQFIVQNAAAGNVLNLDDWQPECVNIISCPSCARVENERFVALAEQVRDAVRPVTVPLTIAVMGCRVNGPGETDHADIGLWCGKHEVNLKRGKSLIGSFSYDEVISKMLEQIERG